MAINNTNLFVDYYRSKTNDGTLDVNVISSYHASIIFDFDNRTLWHQGKPFGNSYWHSYFGEAFNDFVYNSAKGDYSHAEGHHTSSFGNYSHAEGLFTTSSGIGSHSEGSYTIASANNANASGYHTNAIGENSRSEGTYTTSFGAQAHATGAYTYANGANSFTGGLLTSAYGNNSIAFGHENTANGTNSAVFGHGSTSIGTNSFSQGDSTTASGEGSHSEGNYTNSTGQFSHSEGNYTNSTGESSHAEGSGTNSTGKYAHAEGEESIAEGQGSHAEGRATCATANYSHTEGWNAKALAEGAHAEGEATEASGKYSHVQGKETKVSNDYEFACGQFNESVKSDKTAESTLFTIGDGVPGKRHNVVDIRHNGDMHKNGTTYFNDNVYGPVSHTYVASLGKEAELDIVLSSLLSQPEYTKPKMYVSFVQASNNSWSGFNTNSLNETVEIGTTFRPGIRFRWQTRQSSASGTRANDLTQDGNKIANYLLGYSYGVNGHDDTSEGIYWKYNPGGSALIENFNNGSAYMLETNYQGTDNVGVQTTIRDNSTYTMFKEISIDYLHASYMFFQQLYDKQVYVVAKGLNNTAWFNDGTYNFSNVVHTVTGRYRYFWGITSTVPKNRSDLTKGKTGFLTIGGDTTVSLNPIGDAYAGAKILWIAFPDDNAVNARYYLKKFNDTINVCCTQPDGIAFDLISASQPAKSISLQDIPAAGNANFKRKYKVIYIEFQNPIGNKNNRIDFKLTSNSSDKSIITV